MLPSIPPVGTARCAPSEIRGTRAACAAPARTRRKTTSAYTRRGGGVRGSALLSLAPAEALRRAPKKKNLERSASAIGGDGPREYVLRRAL
jgi:hypothetical protein